MLVGIPLLFVSLVLGLEWAFLSIDKFSIIDAKILGSFCIAIIYLVILLLHRSKKMVSTTYAWAQIFVFLLIVINFFLGSKLSTFHLWY